VARHIGRRSVFFAVVALIGVALVYPTPEQYRWTAWFVVILAAFWAVVLAIEDLSRPTYGEEPSPRVDNPFAPPPPPALRREERQDA
jgi:hypothetical protein